jgi:hypothetical protein
VKKIRFPPDPDKSLPQTDAFMPVLRAGMAVAAGRQAARFHAFVPEAFGIKFRPVNPTLTPAPAARGNARKRQ